MSNKPFRVQQIDHVEVYVPDRYEAAKWYGQVFGLEIVKDFEYWAETPGGPLMLTTERGGTKIALFEGQPRGDHQWFGTYRVAFGVDGAGFIAFLRRLDAGEIEIWRDDKLRLTAGQVVDHTGSWSIYFNDPWGNRYEITTYDYDLVRERL